MEINLQYTVEVCQWTQFFATLGWRAPVHRGVRRLCINFIPSVDLRIFFGTSFMRSCDCSVGMTVHVMSRASANVTFRPPVAPSCCSFELDNFSSLSAHDNKPSEEMLRRLPLEMSSSSHELSKPCQCYIQIKHYYSTYQKKSLIII